ncbi:MAG: chromosome segregation protein SMC [Nitrospinota bacterium]|nr:chromosome segregation protein SMC [Nitrospinota bacterium]
MILKQLELAGFKSFVDTTRLDFTNGFTAVVGPNGCGKSNISDAIRWIIGEQSSKALRGTRITDLIFNGSSGRKPVNRTEISMTLSDVPKGLRVASVPNLSDEIKVTRCYHRSGDSEFYINKVPCRLKDITDLFLDIGISPKVLTVIEQGHIQDMISSKPEERRIWIEEAAGVLKFKVRKAEALRKLDASGQNLDRISDIVNELERQVESLKRQANKAERYKKFQGEIKELSLGLFSKKIRGLKVQFDELEEAYREKMEQKTQWAARSSTLENDISRMKIEIDELTTALNQKRGTLHQLTAEISNSEHNIALRNSQIQQAESDKEAAAREIQQMQDEIGSHSEERETHRRDLAEAEEKIAVQGLECEEKTRECEHSRGLMRTLENELQDRENRILELLHHLSQKKNSLTELESRRKFLNDQGEKLTRELEETRGHMESVQAAVGEAQSQFDQKEQDLEARRQELIQLQEQLSVCKEQLKDGEAKARVVKEAYLSKASLLSSLRELRSQYEGFGQGVRSLMSQNSRPEGLREVVVDVLQAPAEYEKAVEAVLGEKLQSMIVNTYSDTLDVIRYMNENHPGRGSFIPLNPKSISLKPVYLNGDTGVVGKLGDLVETREEYKSVFDHLLNNVVLVRDLETALKLHANSEFEGTVVTLDGEVIDGQGLVTGGRNGEDPGGLLSQTREMEELGVLVAELQKNLEQLEEANINAENEFSAVEESHRAAGASVHEVDIEQRQCRNDLEQAKKELERLEQKKAHLEYELSSGIHELDELTGEFDTLTHDIRTGEEEKEQTEAVVEDLRVTLRDQRQETEVMAGWINEVNVKIASMKGQRDNVRLEIKRLDLQEANLNQRIEQRSEDSRVNSERISENQKAIVEIEQNILEKVREKDRLSGEVIGEEEGLREQEEMLEAKDRESRELGHKVQQITEEVSAVDLKRSEVKIQISHIEEKAFEDFNVSLQEMLNQYDGEVDVETASEELKQLKEKVAKLGEVNLAALSEYQIASERYNFLQKQLEDLADSIRALHETIEKIDQTTRKLFKETFEQVNEHFKDNFTRLFLGGKAELTLTDPENILESGIDITASPLGKSMSNITLLSGGEKTMTAIALMFAILKVRPSPFCLLDEVDAPLDEANVIRFQEMLKEMSDKTQFIIITHNQKTMSFADTLYGVTMEERGVSKVVSVNLN